MFLGAFKVEEVAFPKSHTVVVSAPKEADVLVYSANTGGHTNCPALLVDAPLNAAVKLAYGIEIVTTEFAVSLQPFTSVAISCMACVTLPVGWFFFSLKILA